MKIKLDPKHPDLHKYDDLARDKVYEVLGIEADDYRIFNDLGRPYIYPQNLFARVDATEPEDWVNHYGKGGERYAYPEEIGRPGFFEDYFDHKSEAIAALHTYQEKRWSHG